MELIEPVETRIVAVKTFLHDVKPSLDCLVVPITDGFGPTVPTEEQASREEAASMDLIVLSQETRKGGQMINTEREKLVHITTICHTSNKFPALVKTMSPDCPIFYFIIYL